MRAASSLLLLLLGGCSLLEPSNELRVTEYSGSYLTAAMSGCRVVGEKEPPGCVTVTTEHCSYKSAGCE